jgi:hypothetical protein
MLKDSAGPDGLAFAQYVLFGTFVVLIFATFIREDFKTRMRHFAPAASAVAGQRATRR